MKLLTAWTVCVALAALCACASKSSKRDADPAAGGAPAGAGQGGVALGGTAQDGGVQDGGAQDGGAQADALRDIVWRLVDLRGAPARPGVDGVAPELGLQSKSGRAAGSTGVNRFNGPFKLDDERLSFGALVSTRRAGPEELMKQESMFLAALADCRRWGLLDGKFELRDGKGIVLARFERAGG